VERTILSIITDWSTYIYATIDEKVIQMLSIQHQLPKGHGKWTEEERKARLSHGSRNSNEWEEKYAEFEAHDGMPAKGTKSYIWKQTQVTFRFGCYD
jgi:hypothetical protein